MRWRLVVSGAVLSALAYAGYACTTDTFTAGDAASDAASDARAPVTQTDFCNAEAKYLAHCQADAACAAANLNNCGSTFAALGPALAAAIATCAESDQLECNVDLGGLIGSPCIQAQLAGYTNDSGALAQLGADFCKACAPTSQASCATKFSSAPDQPGYLASLFNDLIISQMDTACAEKLDGGTAIVGDASLTCAQQFVFCDYILLALTLPSDACKDGG